MDPTPDGADEIVTACGIGGRDVALRKTIDEITLIAFMLAHFQSMSGVWVPDSVD